MGGTLWTDQEPVYQRPEETITLNFPRCTCSHHMMTACHYKFNVTFVLPTMYETGRHARVLRLCCAHNDIYGINPSNITLRKDLTRYMFPIRASPRQRVYFKMATRTWLEICALEGTGLARTSRFGQGLESKPDRVCSRLAPSPATIVSLSTASGNTNAKCWPSSYSTKTQAGSSIAQ
jgi:hypothetical protein